MARPYKTLEDVEKKLMQNPKFQEEYEKNKPYSDIAMEIIRVRSLSGLTQAELAKKVGTTQSVISAIESLNIDDIKLSTINKIAQALNMRIDIKFIPAA